MGLFLLPFALTDITPCVLPIVAAIIHVAIMPVVLVAIMTLIHIRIPPAIFLAIMASVLLSAVTLIAVPAFILRMTCSVVLITLFLGKPWYGQKNCQRRKSK
ncbi:MAG TPA: hypothetical protein VOA41_19875 [Candidatus Dormibacteraeota bacterium]|nr:hypothetical protein [Candidatus Dormibacteraeota bacterium]